MIDERTIQRHRVLIAGGGVAGLEALIALHHLAGDRTEVTLMTPSDEFVVRALDVAGPFGGPPSPAFDVEGIGAAHGAEVMHDAVHMVHPDRQVVTSRAGRLVEYDSLLLAIGAQAMPAYEDVLTFRGAHDAEAMAALVAEVRSGTVSSVAFVVPPGTTWTLPLYELAFMVAEVTHDAGRAVELSFITPELEPLGLFGRKAGARVW